MHLPGSDARFSRNAPHRHRRQPLGERRHAGGEVRDRRLQVSQPAPVAPFQVSPDEVVLGREVAVEAHLRHAGLGNDAVDADAPQAVLDAFAGQAEGEVFVAPADADNAAALRTALSPQMLQSPAGNGEPARYYGFGFNVGVSEAGRTISAGMTFLCTDGMWRGEYSERHRNWVLTEVEKEKKAPAKCAAKTAKPAAKEKAKAEVKAEAKPEVKTEVKAEAKPAAKTTKAAAKTTKTAKKTK